MSALDFLRRLVQALDQAGIDYMVAGSTASSFHGEPRSTNDVDLVVDLGEASIRALRSQLPHADYYFDEGAAMAALRRKSQFNVIDLATGWKADLICLKDRPFSQQEFSRRLEVTLDGIRLWMATAEDVILSKLEWARKAGSERQLRDVRSVLAQQRDTLDFDYLQRWVQDLGLVEEWRAVSRVP